MLYFLVTSVLRFDFLALFPTQYQLSHGAECNMTKIFLSLKFCSFLGEITKKYEKLEKYLLNSTRLQCDN